MPVSPPNVGIVPNLGLLVENVHGTWWLQTGMNCNFLLCLRHHSPRYCMILEGSSQRLWQQKLIALINFVISFDYWSLAKQCHLWHGSVSSGVWHESALPVWLATCFWQFPVGLSSWTIYRIYRENLTASAQWSLPIFRAGLSASRRGWICTFSRPLNLSTPTFLSTRNQRNGSCHSMYTLVN